MGGVVVKEGHPGIVLAVIYMRVARRGARRRNVLLGKGGGGISKSFRNVGGGRRRWGITGLGVLIGLLRWREVAIWAAR